MIQKNLRVLIIIICMAAAGICYSCNRFDGAGLVLTEDSSAEEISEKGISEEISVERNLSETISADMQPTKDIPAAIAEKPTCYVHICGEVNAPGVYAVDEGERVFKAVELAGGFTEQAASDYLNMAETVSDGMKLVVPNVQELESGADARYGGGSGYNTSATGSTGSGQSRKVNINTASKEELMTLSGIGQSRADDIIRYREDKGRFQTIEDIMKVPGIKNAAFEKLKEDISV